MSAATSTPHLTRCLAVWVAITGGLVGLTAWCGADARSVLTGAAWQTWHGPTAVEGVLTAVCAAAALACVGWWWVVATVTALQLLAGADPADLLRRGGATRRVLLGLCGAAAVAQLTQPAVAADRAPVRPLEDEGSLAGLALPDRATVDSGGESLRSRPARSQAGHQAGHQAGPTSSRMVTVRAGDSLWSLTAHTAPAATDAEIDRLWRAAYAANHDVVGDDPDLIHPGQRLRLPDPSTTQEQP